MKKLENKSHLADEARQLDQKTPTKMNAGEAQNFDQTHKLTVFQKLFGIDRKRDIDDIKK